MISFNPVRAVGTSDLEVVTLTEAKQHLKIDTDDQDSLLRLYLAGVVKACEDYRQAAIMSTQHELYSSFFDSVISLQKHPVTAINSVKYYDENGDLQTVDSSEYRLQDFMQPCMLEFDADFEAPDLHDRDWPVVINFNAGYTSASSVPATIKLGILNELGNFNEFRQSFLAGNGLTAVEIKSNTMSLLDSETMWI